ncbi:MAG TPA: dihydroxyacetone kinase subunit DhaL [Candidatus Limnocylindrales bacterium]|nr:dihydroxyacetone kinase subunit DhaL [Candidatus Limnocylindrales bacterium]
MSTRSGDHRPAVGSPGSPRVAPDDGSVPPGQRAPVAFTGRDLAAIAARAERLLLRNRALLDRLDAELGDGDHGENMSVGFGDAVRAMGRVDRAADVGDLLRRMGHLLVAGVGGAGGSLYGTAFIEAGIAVAGLEALSPEDTARALDAAAEGIARRGRCRIGDKTIYDALRPAADAFAAALASGAGQEAAVLGAIRAARDGMLATTPLVARRGLALRLGERSRGHQDPGATSCYLLIRSLLATGRRGA